MKDYTYIDSIEPQDGGLTNVLIRGNKHAIIKITKFADKFRAEIYHIYSGNPEGTEKKHKSFLKKIERNDANEVLENALGWIDENQGSIPEPEEIRMSDIDK